MRKSEFVTFAKCFSNDIDNYNEKLKVLSKEKNFKLDILGYLNNNLKDKIILIDHYISNELPSILIAGSFHGEEPAGAWGILKFLHDINKNDINKINLSFLPLVNPTGVKNETDLLSMVNKLDQLKIVYSKYYEPDLNNELVSIAIEPSDKSRKVTSNLSLLLKGYRKNYV